jgi:hypothetical protein
MMKVPLNGDPFGGAQVAAYIGAQSVLQRLNAVLPGGGSKGLNSWRQRSLGPIGSTTGQGKADSGPQAGIYLAGRWLEGYPASELCFAQIAKPGKRRKQMAASLGPTSRTPGQLRGVLARIALAASQIAVCYERYGSDQPWGFADPGSWKCSARWCHAWASCPGGKGL